MGPSLKLTLCAVAILCGLQTSTEAPDEIAPNKRPVKAVADARLSVANKGVLPLYVSRDWSRPAPDITRAIIILHGRLRDADVYYKSAKTAQEAAGEVGRGALLVVPQFLAEIDIDAFHLPSNTLRWTLEGWEGGDDALSPAPVSSFEALDAILARFEDRAIFPNLRQVVVAGHSGGGQVVQRYSIAGREGDTLTAKGISVSDVVANPSSYAYFSSERPEPVIAAACPRFNDWKYGMEARPAYLSSAAPQAVEHAYVSRRVIYLLGTLDTNPAHPALDKSCMARAQGAYRYARGHAYASMMKIRDNGTPNHSVWDVEGVGHDGNAMFTSPCGLTALFEIPGCGVKAR